MFRLSLIKLNMRKTFILNATKSALTMLIIALSLTSCEGLIDAIIGTEDNPALKPDNTAYDPQSFNAQTAPLTLEAVSGTITVNFITDKVIEYSLDDGLNWVASTPSSESIIQIIGNKILLRGNNPSYKGSQIKCNDEFYVYGNIMSLIYGKDFVNKTSFDKEKGESAFFAFLGGNEKLKSHDSKDLVLPASVLTKSCYERMFINCKSMTRAPALPAKDLTGADGCYRDMFENCLSLVSAPELPATKLAQQCYMGMFTYCNTITSAPELPATDLTGCDNCYSHMFWGCKGLINAPSLPALKLARQCYYVMFKDCFELEKAPELPATDLTGADGCYWSMFGSCKKLKVVPSLKATKLSIGCYNDMFGGCKSITKAPELPSTELKEACYAGMFQYCDNLTTPPSELPALQLERRCYSSMFSNCHSLTSTPLLPAPNIDKEECYYNMFKGCSSLISVACKATSLTVDSSTENWLDGVSATGTFKKAASMTDWPSGVSGIPSGWTIENM